jgi:hypothetical protein
MGETNSAVVPVARILNLLTLAARSPENRDEKLHNAILAVLGEVGADALIFRVGRDSETLGAFLPSIRWERKRKDLYIKIIAELASLRCRKGCISEPFRDGETDEEYLFSFPGYKQLAPQDPQNNDLCFFCFVSGLRKVKNSVIHSNPWRRIVNWSIPDGANHVPRGSINEQYREAVNSYCAAIEMAMMCRADADSILAPEISEKFWNLHDDLAADVYRTRPWEEDGRQNSRNVLTATLCLDLRRSTFVLESVIDQKKHSIWLERLVCALKEVARLRLGVFDKFTGDGVLAHFPVYAFEAHDLEAASERAAAQCVASSWEMITATELCNDYMMCNLTIEPKDYGASVGVAIDNALWSMSTGGAPITVGRGVVHACRLSQGERGTVEMTNAAFQHIRRRIGCQSDIVVEPFICKEYPEILGATKVVMRRAALELDCNTNAIRDIVRKIFESKE